MKAAAEPQDLPSNDDDTDVVFDRSVGKPSVRRVDRSDDQILESDVFGVSIPPWLTVWFVCFLVRLRVLRKRCAL